MAVKEKQKSICPEETVFGNGTCGKAQAEGKDETEESGAGTLSRKHKKKPESEVMTVLKKIGQDIAGQMPAVDKKRLLMMNIPYVICLLYTSDAADEL